MSPPDVPYIPEALAHPHPARRAALLSELRERPALAALVPALRDGGAAPALAVTRAGDTLELRIQDAGASGEELTRDLQEAGIDGEVRVIPVPPDMVGTWAAIEEASKRPFDPNQPTPGREEIVRLDRIEYGRELLRIPVAEVRESEGHFILQGPRRPGVRRSPPATAPRATERSRTATPAAAMELATANSVEVAITFQSVSENSPRSSAIEATTAATHRRR